MRAKEQCSHCAKKLTTNSEVLFVEKEVGRIFCSEDCIVGFFSPEIDDLESEYFAQLKLTDLSPNEREVLSHLRWITLQEPDETWLEITAEGDHRYILISEFKPDKKKIWCICLCLFLKGQPSFLYLSFPTSDASLVNHYRRKKKILKPKKSKKAGKEKPLSQPSQLTDGLADEWTEDETIRAVLKSERQPQDIKQEQFHLYERNLEETLKGPDEVWGLKLTHKYAFHMYHFIKYYIIKNEAYWYIVVAKETEDHEQIEILDAFPTRDSNLVECYRKGKQEVGHSPSSSTERLIH